MSQKILFSLVATCIIIGSIAGFAVAQKKYSQPSFSTLIFSTLVSRDKGSSVLEKETASTFMGETIVGWTLSPSFSDTLGFGVSARKQERQNVVFEFTTPSETLAAEQSEQFKRYLSKRVGKYNVESNTSFHLLFEKSLTHQNNPKKWMWAIAGAIAGFFIGLFIVEVLRFRKK